jgi:FAD/FMN-containing dehydrogenase
MNTKEIQNFFTGEVREDAATREAYSTDASIFKIQPALVLSPKTTTDIENLVAYVSTQKSTQPELAITTRAAGTCMSGGAIGESIILDVSKHINRLLELTDDHAVVEPGMYYRDFEHATLARNRIMPSYPASKDWCAVGGMVGNNAAGEKTFSYGQTIDYVSELDVVLRDGKTYTFKPLTKSELDRKLQLQNLEGDIYRAVYTLVTTHKDIIAKAQPTTSKNSAGYYLWKVWDGATFDMTKLFVGSQGTLGIITKIKFRLVKPKRQRRLVVFYLNDLKNLGRVITSITKLKPETFELYDDHTLRLALKYIPEMIKKMHGSWLKLAWQFVPDILLNLTKGLPKIVLLAEFSGDDIAAVDKQAHAALKAIQAEYRITGHVTKSFEEAQKYWTVRHESFNLLRLHNARKVSAPFIEDIVVHPEQLPEFLPELDAIFARYPGFVYTIAGHAGDANFHIMPLMDFADEQQRQAIVRLCDEVFALVFKYHGSMLSTWTFPPKYVWR